MKLFVLLTGLVFLFSVPNWGQSGAIDESEFVRIGGIEQWVTIKGSDVSNPVILFLHGGPGSPFTPYADAIFKGWEEDFVLVHWDQRGTGKTFGIYAPEELDPDFLTSNPLTLEQMVQDGIELAEHLINRLGKQKLILFGTSWGSVIGVKMASEGPELFHVYIGHSQLVNPSENNIYNYRQLFELVEEKEDVKSSRILKSIGPPPYDEARTMGQFIQIIKKYERINSDPGPRDWGEIPFEYDNPKDAQHRSDGDDYSFLSYVGDTRFDIEPMITSIDLLEDNYQFQLPVYLIQGKEDILTPLAITKKYFSKIEAPQKELIIVPKAAHGFNLAVVEAIRIILMNKIISEMKN